MVARELGRSTINQLGILGWKERRSFVILYTEKTKKHFNGFQNSMMCIVVCAIPIITVN